MGTTSQAGGMSLADRVAVVTGGSSGIGRGIARRLAADGATIVNADVRREPRRGEHFETDTSVPTDELVADEYGVDARFVETDTADPEDAERTIEDTIAAFNRVDILVNNAGIIVEGSTRDVDVEAYHRAIDVNLNGYVHMAKYAIPHLVASPAGRIVNISSVNAYYGGGGPAYAAPKAAIVNLTRDLAVEVAEAGVTANAVLPGVVKTALQDVGGDDAIERRRGMTPLPRLGEPEDVGNAVAFLASDDAEWITGAELLVDGGYMAGRH